jgi:hypothetical protein
MQHGMSNTFERKGAAGMFQALAKGNPISRIFQEALVKSDIGPPVIDKVQSSAVTKIANRMPIASLVVGGYLLTQALHPSVAPELGDPAGRGGEYYEKLKRKQSEETFNPIESVTKQTRHSRNIQYVLDNMVKPKTAWVKNDSFSPELLANDVIVNRQTRVPVRRTTSYSNNDAMFYKRVSSLS